MRMRYVGDRPMEHPERPDRVRALERMIAGQLADQIRLTVSRRRLARDVRRLRRLTGRMTAARVRLRAAHNRLRTVRWVIRPAGEDL